MMAGDSENIWEMDTNESETENVTMTTVEVEAVKSEDVDSKPVTADAKEEKPEVVAVQRTKRGYKILEIERNFEVRASQKKGNSRRRKSGIR